MRISSFHVMLSLVIAGVMLAGCGNVRSEKTSRNVHEVSSKTEAKSEDKSDSKSEGGKTDSKSVAEAPKKTDDGKQGEKEPVRVAQAPAKAEKSEDDMLEPNRSELTLPTEDKGSSLLSIETVTPKRHQINKNYSYEIRLTNVSDKSQRNVALANVRVTQQIPPKMTIGNGTKITITNRDGKTISGRRQQITLPSGAGDDASAAWTIGLLEPGDKAVISVTAKGAERGRLVNYLSVNYDPLLRLETEITQSDIRLAKAGPKQPVDNCRKIEYTYVLKNEGNEAVKDLTVQDKLDGGLKTAGGDAEAGKDTVTLTCVRLGGGEEKKWTVIVEASKPGTYKSAAVATWPGTKTTMSNSKKKMSEFDAKSAVVATEVRLGKLKIDVQQDRAAQYAGQKVTYTVTVTNEGNAKVDQPQVVAMLDKAAIGGAVNPPATSANTWKLPSLDPGKTSAPLKITVGSTTLGKMESKFETSFNCDGQTMKDTAAVTTEIKPIDLAVAVSPSEARVEQGSAFTCVLLVSNRGAAADQDVNLTVTLPEFAAFETLEGDVKASYDSKTRVVTVDTLPQIGPNETKVMRLRVKADKAGKGKFLASLKSKALAGAAANFESDAVTSAPAKKAEQKTPAKTGESKGTDSPSDKPKAADKSKPAESPKPADKTSPKAGEKAKG